ncbi:MAG TPA: DUF3426 domain-containing protein [Accumulibacter sp.]|nr:DUF3426 domain-containing protein [Accumulibacter sp.]
MRTVCPSCQTAFHVSPPQLRARAGRVRCGKCASAFNALDYLFDDDQPLPQPAANEPSAVQLAADVAPAITEVPQAVAEETAALTTTPESAGTMVSLETAPEEAATTPSSTVEASEPLDTAAAENVAAGEPAPADIRDAAPLATAPAGTQTLPGGNSDYRRWVNVASDTPGILAARQGYRRPYLLAAALLALTLLGQLLFHFRTPLAIAIPTLWPALNSLSEVLGTDMPLSRHIEQISIESSDLQVEPNKKGSLILQATLRNRADYPQTYPALELTLTDVNDSVLVKRVFLPGDYLSSPADGSNAFTAHTDLDIRMWLAASEVNSAGYRLYVFYP